jgi:DNA-binding NarL/FixJ family response regulator
MVDELSVDGRVLIAGSAELVNGSIALVEGSVLPEGVLRTLHAAFPSRIVTYLTLFQIVRERHEEYLPRLIILGTEIANGTIENTIRSLSDLAPKIPIVVLAPKDDKDLARKVISLGAKAYIPVPTGCEVVAVIRFILELANWPS